MRTLAAAALVATALVAVPSSHTAQDSRRSDGLERPFPANGHSNGPLGRRVHITGSKENRVTPPVARARP
jgi:hypothetical protein